MVAPRDPSDDGRDVFRPPDIPTEVSCLHCGEVYESYRIEWREGAGPPGDAGAWCCPTPGCDGLGFLFDIWPTDPDWRDEDGEKVCWSDEEGDDDGCWDDDDENDAAFGNADLLWPPSPGSFEPKSLDPLWNDMIGGPPPTDPFPRRKRGDPDEPEQQFEDEDDDEIPF